MPINIFQMNFIVNYCGLHVSVKGPGTGDVAQQAECLPIMNEALGSIRSTESMGSWCTSVISALKMWRQEKQKFKASFSYMQRRAWDG